MKTIKLNSVDEAPVPIDVPIIATDGNVWLACIAVIYKGYVSRWGHTKPDRVLLEAIGISGEEHDFDLKYDNIKFWGLLERIE